MLKSLSNSIKDLVAPDPPPGQPMTHCFVMKTGSTINPDDFSDPSTAPKSLAALFDDIPKVSPAWGTSGKYVSNLWKILLDSAKAPPKPPESKETKEQYKEAIVKLYGSEKGFNNLEKSPYYQSLSAAQKKVTQKQIELLGLQVQIQTILGPNASQAQYQATYQQMAPAYIDAVKSAQQELLLRQRDIDRYTTTLFAYNTGSLQTVLSNFATSKLCIHNVSQPN